MRRPSRYYLNGDSGLFEYEEYISLNSIMDPNEGLAAFNNIL